MKGEHLRKNGPKYRTPHSFQEKVFTVVRKIPKGSVLTYKQVAEKAGNIGAYRAVGSALKKTSIMIFLATGLSGAMEKWAGIIAGEKKK